MSKEIRVSRWLCMIPEACRIVGVTPLEFLKKTLTPRTEGMVLGAAWASMGPCGPQERRMLRDALSELRKELKALDSPDQVRLLFPETSPSEGDVIAVLSGSDGPDDYDGSIEGLRGAEAKVRYIRGLHGHFRGSDALARYTEAAEQHAASFRAGLEAAGITPAKFSSAMETWVKRGKPAISSLVNIGAVPAKFGAALAAWVLLGRPAFSAK